MNRSAVYFASDFHLGADASVSSADREKIIVKWLDTIKADAQILYLVGDIFDYWFEYKHAVPKIGLRLLGKLAELSDSGVFIHYFTGNHDMWVFDYLTKEINVKVHYTPLICTHGNTKFYLAHGDGLGSGDYGYKIIKSIFSNKICQWLYHRLHPNLGLWLMKKMSKTSRHFDGEIKQVQDPQKERIVQHSRQIHQLHKDINHYIYGHRHIAWQYALTDTSTVTYLGDWMELFTYAKFENDKLELLTFRHVLQ